jgi:polyhydroxyalkanoate synthesis repressor PhaR
MTTAPKKKRGRPPGQSSARKAGVVEVVRDPNATLIKKYGNRRLYDTKRSRYVTLEELRDVIAKGEEIQVVEETTGEDVTKRVMTQIILTEEESQHLNLLPVNFLKKLIQYRDESLREYFQKYLTFSMDAYMNAQRMMEQRMAGMGGALDGTPPPAAPQQGAGNPLFPWLNVPMGLNPFMAMKGLTAPPAAPAPPAPPPPANDMVADEVAELRRRLAELETRYKK